MFLTVTNREVHVLIFRGLGTGTGKNYHANAASEKSGVMPLLFIGLACARNNPYGKSFSMRRTSV